MPSRNDYLETWGEDNTVPFPRAAWLETFSLPEDVYPSVDFLPIDMSVVYTSYLDGEVDLYDTVALQGDDETTTRFALIGTVPADKDMWFLFSGESGEVYLLDTAKPSIELVNSSLRAFTEFLYFFSLFVDADEGAQGRAARAVGLHSQLSALDPGAFENAESWWSAVFHQLGTAETTAS